MKVYNVTDERFKKYGKIVKGIDFSGLVKALEESTLSRKGWLMFRDLTCWRRFRS